MATIEQIYELYLQFPKVLTDSRKIEKNCLFFALKGENFNGNQYAREALEKGAAYAIIDEQEFQVSEMTILVKDVLETLQNLARYHRKKLNIPILGITGTNGKTTTKELVSAVLSQKFKVCFTQGNLNNHIGVPLTMLAMNSTTEFGVVEMGANHPGEIAELCSIADPDYGIITNVGKAHLEGFGSFEGVKKTKAELYEHLKEKKGVVFIKKENQHLQKMATNVKNKISYGKSGANLNGEILDSPPFLNLKVNFKKGVLYLNTWLIGDFNFENVLAAACIGNYFGVDPLKIQKAIKEYYPKNNRSQLIKKGNLNIIMDAYNANPTSLTASIKSFSSIKSAQKYLILGDMLELGEYSEKEHLEIVKLIDKIDISEAFLVGANFSKAGEKSSCKTFGEVEELATYLAKKPIKNGNILIKGSRGIQLEKILEFLN